MPHPLSVKNTYPLILTATLFVASPTTQADSYNSLAIDKAFKAQTIELDVDDKTRSRQIPLRIYFPQANNQPAEVVLFGHGLVGSYKDNAYMGSASVINVNFCAALVS